MDRTLLILIASFLFNSSASAQADDPDRKKTDVNIETLPLPDGLSKDPKTEGEDIEKAQDEAEGLPSQDPQPGTSESEEEGAPAEPESRSAREDFVLDEVFITANRQERDLLSLTANASLVDAEELRDRAVSTTPDALEEEVGVLIQKTNLGGGSPIIRGRSGKSILLLIDGQRFNNSTFRRNNQYLNTIDLGAVDRVEVVRGPASVLFGSDAMGGAVNILTRRRKTTGENALGGRFFSTYESAMDGWTNHLSIEEEIEGWGVTGGATFKSFGHLRAGRVGDPIGSVDIDGLQDPTAYRERDYSFSLYRELSDQDSIDFQWLYSRQYDVPRSDKLIANENQEEPPDLRRHADPQRLRWYSLRWTHSSPEDMLESIVVSASVNNPDESRERIKSKDPQTLILEKDEIFVPGLNAQAGLRYKDDHLLTTGFDIYNETIDSERSTVDLTTGLETPSEFGRYPDDATYRSFGVFAQDDWEINDTLTWTNGIRYSSFRVDLDLEGLVVGPLPPFEDLEETFDDFTFSTGLNYKLTEETSLYGSIARGFRAPNLDDLAVLGDFSSGNRVPNLDLDPESVLSFEVGTHHRSADAKAGAAVSYSLYKDLFDSVFVFEEDGEDFFQIDNAARAKIYTIETWFEYRVIPSSGARPDHFVYAQAFWTAGRNTSEGEPLSKIPPPQGSVGYRLEQPDGDWFFESFLRGAIEQDKLSSSDESDPRIPDGGTPAWWTANLRGGLQLGEGLRVTAALENIFDHRYRVHASGIDAPGLNAVLSLDFRF